MSVPFPKARDSNLAATALLAKFDRKWDQWSEAVQSINFLHSNQKRGVY